MSFLSAPPRITRADVQRGGETRSLAESRETITHWRRTLAALLLPMLLLVTVPMGSADGNKSKLRADSEITGAPATLSRVKLLLEKDSPRLEITSTRPITPLITKIQHPPGLRIDLNNAEMSVRHKEVSVHGPLIETLELDQLLLTPPVVRIVVNQRRPLSYTWDVAGNRLTIHLHIESEEVTARPPSVPAIAPGLQPAAVPVSTTGDLGFADQAASGSSFTAKFATETLRLSRGGEVHLCPGTTISIVRQKKGPDLMLAMGVGGLETHYALDDAADTIVTPDFRILLRGPGEFHYAIRADAQGNTCVRSLPGNTAPVIVYEAIGNGQFEVVPTEKLVLHAGHLSALDTAFHSGQVAQVETIVPDDCGCPPPPPLLRSQLANLPTLAKNNVPTSAIAPPVDDSDPLGTMSRTLSDGPEIAPPPALAPNQEPLRASASLVFSSKDARPPKLFNFPLSRRPGLLWDDEVQPPLQRTRLKKKTALQTLGRFFSRIFRY
jgi:hypothetical protein